MSVNSITSLAAQQTNNSSSSSKKSSSDLSMDDFFTLLSAQLQYQDPTQPTDNSQFMAQMAQFSLLEQVQNLAKSLSVTVASSAIGRGAIYNVADSQGNVIQQHGVINAVDLSSDSPEYLINGGWVDQSNIVYMYDGAADSSGDPSSGDSGSGDNSGSPASDSVNT